MVEIQKFTIKSSSVYSLNSLVTIAFKDENTIDLSLSKPLKKDIPSNYECNVNDAEKYIDADINIIGLLCSCHYL